MSTPTDPGRDPREGDWFETNRRMWDERVPIHVGSRFYDVEGFRAGGVVLRDFEIEEVGDVAGRDLVHLQCHFGLDTLSWARLGARVTGLDFSEPAITAARALAGELGLDARFVAANVYDAADALGATYDLVYTGFGAICWLPDLARWARVVRSLVKFHPVGDILADDDLVVARPYFGGPEPTLWDESGTYADAGAATTHTRSFEWTHPVSAVIQVLLDEGLALESFREHDYTLYPRWPFLELTGRDTYRLPADRPSLPLMYSIRLRREA
ncbi:MAG: class I SAM-dependent methyltransferase [Planctomycetota bacterium]|jgi:SAM-dependent methyltransferase